MRGIQRVREALPFRRAVPTPTAPVEPDPAALGLPVAGLDLGGNPSAGPDSPSGGQSGAVLCFFDPAQGGLLVSEWFEIEPTEADRRLGDKAVGP